jgi:hypothetical protein
MQMWKKIQLLKAMIISMNRSFCSFNNDCVLCEDYHANYQALLKNALLQSVHIIVRDKLLTCDIMMEMCIQGLTASHYHHHHHHHMDMI